MKKLLYIAIALLAFPAFAGEQMGFAAGNEPATAAYSPDSDFAYNSMNGPITVNRVNVGLYRVTFTGLVKAGLKHSNVQVSSWGSGKENCGARSWVRPPGTTDFVVNIHCVSVTTGANVDAKWTVLATIIQ